MKERIITLLTDFGEEDWFVGSMKGVMASICPEARTIDITHLIPSGDIRRGSFALRCAYRYFSRGTVHLAVVDPGVGSTRDILVVQGGGYIFVAPDNGLLSYILADLKEKTIYYATRNDLFLDEVSNTFHGRDIFAPLAAHLTSGVPVEQIGPVCANPVIFPLPICRPSGNSRWDTEIITTDKFGNCITSLSLDMVVNIFHDAGRTSVTIVLRGEETELPLVDSYDSVRRDKLLAIPSSCGFLELAVNGGSAALQLSLQAGDRVTIKIK